MEKEFIPYEQALSLKELGFDEECFSYYNYKEEITFSSCFNKLPIIMSGKKCAIPTFSQAFRWFREKYGLKIGIDVWANNYEKWWYCIYSKKNGEWDILLENNNIEFYEEAELECLNKLIELCKKN